VVGKKMSERAQELAERHWKTYVKKIVEAHEPNPEVVEKCGVHYILTFIHGYKHGIEDSEFKIKGEEL